MSAFECKADIDVADLNVCKWPKAHKAAFTNKAGLDLVLEFGLSNGRSCELSKIGKRGVTQQAPERLTCCVEA